MFAQLGYHSPPRPQCYTDSMYFLLGLSPLLILIGGLLLFRWSVLKAASLAWLTALLVAVGVWQMPLPAVTAAGIKAAIIATEISLILAGALIFFRTMTKLGLITQLENWLHQQSADARVQLILIAWFFGSFLEGTAGFGLPAMVVAPLLIRFGYRPLTAMVTALVANTSAVVFGAVGTPILIGLSSVGYTVEVTRLAALLSALIGIWIPSLLVIILARLENQPVKPFLLAVLPFTLLAGGSFSLGLVTTAWLVGAELAAIGGAVTGAALSLLSLRTRFCHPAKTFHLVERTAATPVVYRYWFAIPYLSFIALLLLGKAIIPPLAVSILGSTLSINLVNPGLVFLLLSLAALITARILQCSIPHSQEAIFEPTLFRQISRVAVAILFLVGLSQLFLLSSTNPAGLPGMLAVGVVELRTAVYPLLAPLLGALGAFAAGSVTVSTILLAPVQALAATATGLSVAWILALQVVGATAGNMISLTNIVAVRSAVKSHLSEAHILKELLPWFVVYVGMVLVTVVAGWVVGVG